MTPRFRQLLCLMTLVAVGPLFGADEPTVTYEGEVKPILVKNCGKCHNAERPRGELDLSTYSGVTSGGISGKAVVAGKAEQSLLFTLTSHLEDPKMPPNSPKIPQRDIDVLKKWIDGGLLEKAKKASTVEANSASPTVVIEEGLLSPLAFARPTPVTALAASPTSSLVAFPGKKQVLIHDLLTEKLLGGLAFPEGEVHCLRFSADGKVLLAAGGQGGSSGVVIGFDTTSWKRLFSIIGETDAVLAADISTDNRRVVFGGPTRTVKIASIPDGKILHTFRKPTDWVLSVGFSPDGLLVAAGDRFGGLYVWETKSGKEFFTLRGHTKAVMGLAWRHDSELLASCSEDRTVRFWDLHTGSELNKWEAHDEGVLDLKMDIAGNLITGGRDQLVKQWDAKGKLLKQLPPMNDAVLKLCLASKGNQILSGDWSGQLRFTSLEDGKTKSLSIPMHPKTNTVDSIPVPVPVPPRASVSAVPESGSEYMRMTREDLERKRANLKAIEEAVERTKDEAARNPKNASLAKAYLQLCEAALALKIDLLESEAAMKSGPRSTPILK